MKVVKALAAMLALAVTGCRQTESTAEIPAVRGFDAGRYMGKWYEIARLPHRFEAGMSRVTAEYGLRDADTLTVWNSGYRDGVEHRIRGEARFKGDPGTGELEVTFFWPFYGDYRIIELAPDYSSAIVTSGTKDYLWVLARTPELAPEVRREYWLKLGRWGFRTDRLISDSDATR